MTTGQLLLPGKESRVCVAQCLGVPSAPKFPMVQNIPDAVVTVEMTRHSVASLSVESVVKNS